MGRTRARVSLALFAAAMFSAAVWAAMSVEGARAITDCDTETAGNDSAELAMLQLVNSMRASQGANALVVSPNLNRMAAWKSGDSSNLPPLSHTDSLGRAPFERATDCGYGSGAAENIAYGYPSAQATFDAWMASSGHRANILNPTYVAIGIGHTGNSWAMNFGFLNDGGAPAPTNTPAAPTSTSPPTSTATPPNTPPGSPTQAPPTQTAPTQAPPTATRTIASPTQSPGQPAPTFTPTVPAPTKTAATGRQMIQGLNLVTYSGPALPVEHALGSLGSNVEWVYTWDGSNWLRYFPGQPPYVNTLKTLQPGVAYFIAMRGAASWGY